MPENMPDAPAFQANRLDLKSARRKLILAGAVGGAASAGGFVLFGPPGFFLTLPGAFLGGCMAAGVAAINAASLRRSKSLGRWTPAGPMQTLRIAFLAGLAPTVLFGAALAMIDIEWHPWFVALGCEAYAVTMLGAYAARRRLGLEIAFLLILGAGLGSGALSGQLSNYGHSHIIDNRDLDLSIHDPLQRALLGGLPFALFWGVAIMLVDPLHEAPKDQPPAD
jgi:hypothetical protein